jgi:hypothetical protein
MRMRKVKLAFQNLSAHRPVLSQLVEPSEHANLYPPPLRLIRFTKCASCPANLRKVAVARAWPSLSSRSGAFDERGPLKPRVSEPLFLLRVMFSEVLGIVVRTGGARGYAGGRPAGDARRAYFDRGLKREMERIGSISHLVAPDIAHWVHLVRIYRPLTRKLTIRPI